MLYNQDHSTTRASSAHDPDKVCVNNTTSQEDLFLTRLLDASLDGILTFDRACRYTSWNLAMERLSGIPRENVLGKHAFDVFPFLIETGEDKCFFAALGGESTFSENRPYIIPESGREGFFKGYYSPLRDEQNRIVGGIGFIRDITEQKRAEEAAHDAYQRLSFHLENSLLAVIEWDSDFRVSRWSESAERLFGWQAEEVIGKHFNEWHFVFDEDADAVKQVTNRQRVGEEVQGVLRNRNYTKDGSVVHCEWYNSVLHDHEGNLVSVLSQVKDVTAQKLAEEERASLLQRERDARRQAQESDRLKDEFLATLSHELRTPLVSILGWATMIRKGEIEESDSERAIEIIERNARSQARLIDDLLDVSRIITGNLRLDIRAIDLGTVIEAAKDALLPTAEAKRISLHTEFERNGCLVKGDPNRLRQVIWNLVLNAIKFTPRGGSVTVTLECADPYGRLKVIDTGEGIAPEFLPYVFDRFRQAEGSVTRRQGGLGLGLAVVRHLVELHGGQVTAQSSGSGQGSTFTVDLPLAEDRRDPRRCEKREPEDERRRDVRQGGRSGPSHIVGVRVLLIEDDDDSRRLLTLLLNRQGADVVAVSSSVEALGILGEPESDRSSEVGVSEDSSGSSPIRMGTDHPPDIVISDIGMAEEDGYELMRKLRRLPPEQGGLVPAIALTGYATRKDRDHALAAGYQIHLAKPVEPQDLVNAIASLVKARL